MRKIIIALCVIFFWLGAIGETAVQTFSAMGEYTMSDLETPEIAEQRAIAYARQRAAEQAGVYVASYTRTEGMAVAEDEVKALASKSLEIIEQKTYKEAQPNGDIHIKAEIVTKVDTSDIDRIIKAQGAERERKREALTQSYRDMQEATAAFEKKNEVLRQKITEAKASNQDLSALKEETKSQEREFLSMQKVDEAGAFLFRGGEVDAVMALLHEALRLNPKNYSAYYERGFVYSIMDDYARAIEDYNRTLELSPNYVLAYISRGDAYSDMKDYARAIEDYNRAIEDYNRTLELDPNYVNAYNNRGVTYYLMKDYARAIEDYNRALELDPNYASAYNNRGAAYAGMKDYARAIEDYSRVLELDPKDALAYSNRGNAYSRMKDYARAIADYNRSLELDPKDASTYIHRGAVYNNMEDYTLAIEDYNRALELDSKNASAYSRRGVVHNNMGDYARAIADYNCALELNPEDAETYWDRGRAFKNIKDYVRAIADYGRALELNPNEARIYADRGFSYDYLGDIYQAIEDYTRALDIGLDSRRAVIIYCNRADLYMKKNNYEKALADAENALRIEPNKQRAQEIRQKAIAAMRRR